MDNILEVKGLVKDFGDVRVLDNIDMEVEKGEFLAIMGPSGSGKSTLLYAISGMDRPTAGAVFFAGDDLMALDDDRISDVRLRRMGFIFQHSYLLKNLSVRDNVVLPGFKAGIQTRDQIASRAEELMERTGIASIAGHDIRKVSGGQLQRAAFCRSMINRPDILFGDEPTGALNSSSTSEIMDMINSQNAEGTTVVLVTHDAKVAARADRVIFILDGAIHDELELGKYEAAGSTELREKRLYDWLEKHGF